MEYQIVAYTMLKKVYFGKNRKDWQQVQKSSYKSDPNKGCLKSLTLLFPDVLAQKMLSFSNIIRLKLKVLKRQCHKNYL